MKKSHIIVTIFLLTFAFLPILAFAEGFQPIVPLPDITPDITFGQYINRLFTLVISLSAILAVLVIIYGGFEYMTASAGLTKKNGSERIQGAVTGLLLLLSVTLILQVINPCILEITVLSGATPETTAAACSRAPGGAPQQTTPLSPFQGSPQEKEIPQGYTISEAYGVNCSGTGVNVCHNPTRVRFYTDPVNNRCTDPAAVLLEMCPPVGANPETGKSLDAILTENNAKLGACEIALLPNPTERTATACCANAFGSDCVLQTSPVSCRDRSVTRQICVNASTQQRPATPPPSTTAVFNGVQTYANPNGRGTIEINLVGQIRNCPTTIYKICFNSQTQTYPVPTYRAGVPSCTAPAQLLDVCDRP